MPWNEKTVFLEETMRKVEIFTAGCAVCIDVVGLVERLACPSCEVLVCDMHDQDIATRAKSLGVQHVPAVVVDGKPVQGTDEPSLRAAGIGQPE